MYIRVTVTNESRTHLTQGNIGESPTKTPFTKFNVIVNNLSSTAGVTLFTGEHFIQTVRFHVCVVPLENFIKIHTDML